MMFEDMIGVGAAPSVAVMANPLPTEPTELQRQLFTDNPQLDAPRQQAKDLALDAVLYEMRKRHEARRHEMFFDMIGARHTSPPAGGSFDFDFDGASEPDADGDERFPEQEVGGAFERYLTEEFGETDPMQSVLGGEPGVFPIKPETYNPLLEQLPPNYATLAKFGYSESTTDPYGNLMREALRKLVRSV